MAENSKIEWTDHTFNPWIGCTKVSPGCDNCYAEAREDKRLHRVAWGVGQPRHRTKTWGDPKKWNDAHESFFAQHGRRQRVFCASLADVFDNEVDPAWRADLFQLIRATPNLDWLLLTKRIGNVSKMLRDTANWAHAQEATPDLGDLELWLDDWWTGKPAPANVWLGATIVNQEEADRDIPKLLATPARVRFLSMEPLLGPVDLLLRSGEDLHDTLRGQWMREVAPASPARGASLHVGDGPHIDWVIVGGESGHGARPMHPDWAHSLHDQCAAAGVPFMFKQWGEWVSPAARAFGRVQAKVKCACIRQDGTFWDPPPLDDNADALTVVRVGKDNAGRDMFGRTHDGFPVAP